PSTRRWPSVRARSGSSPAKQTMKPPRRLRSTSVRDAPTETAQGRPSKPAGACPDGVSPARRVTHRLSRSFHLSMTFQFSEIGLLDGAGVPASARPPCRGRPMPRRSFARMPETLFLAALPLVGLVGDDDVGARDIFALGGLGDAAQRGN